MPTWLRTSLYNSHSGNGLDALQYLRTTFDAGDGSGSDHAFHLKRIGESVIEPRREICEDDLRSTAAAAAAARPYASVAEAMGAAAAPARGACARGGGRPCGGGAGGATPLATVTAVTASAPSR